MPEDRKITAQYKVAKNEFNGRVSLQLLVDKIY
jgi:single-stranded-DNA-specific exonuclease